MERRRVLGLDNAREETSEDKTDFADRNEIALPTITQNELQKVDVRLDPVLISPLTDVSTNPALSGAVPMAVYSSAVASRPGDISLAAGFYDIFASFHPRLSFASSAMDSIKEHLEMMFAERGKTLLVRVKDHARGITPLDRQFPSAIRAMMTTSSEATRLPEREQKEFRQAIGSYIDELLETTDLDESLSRVLRIFHSKVAGAV
jgi:U3 small nucleolar RNA-associated protein 6